MNTIYEYRHFLKKRYGRVLHSIPIDAAFSCPHRNPDGSGGCSFCSEHGARATQLGELTDIRAQVRAGIDFAKRRYNAEGFMAYFQAYTSTFASTDSLNSLVELICEEEKFQAIIFGTRPDCLPNEVIRYLQSLQQRLDIWVELGVQTIHDKTLHRINRGHDFKTSREAIIKLHDAGISVAVHLILGLPGETVEDFHQTIKTISALPISAIKLHNLHVVEGTTLAREYLDQPFPLFNEHEYAEILLKLLPLIPFEIPIIRLTTDSDESSLIAPRWSMKKGQFRSHLEKLMVSRGTRQGSYVKGKIAAENTPQGQENLEPVRTDDGSITFWNSTIKERYHSQAGARSEAIQKYCLPAELTRRLTQGKVRILDICFGLGYNSLTSCELALQNGGALEIVGLELNRTVVEMAAEKIEEPDGDLNWNSCLSTIAADASWSQDNCSIKLLWGDARHTISQIEGQFDLIWLDAFSTQRNSELWTVDFFAKLLPLLKESGVLCTYSAAIPVRSGFVQAGFHIGETEPFGRERGGTIAARKKGLIKRQIPQRDSYLMETSRGIPYRDPNGTRTNREILRNRELEIVELKKNDQKV